MGIISGITNAVAGNKARKSFNAATKDYVAGIEGMGDLPEYSMTDASGNPIDFRQAQAITGSAANAGPAAQAGPAQTGAMMGAGSARAYAEGLYGGYNPADVRDASYASMKQNVGDAINMAGGRQQDQVRAAERVAIGAAPGIENQYAQGLADHAGNMANTGLNAAAMGTNTSMGNAQMVNSQGQFDAGLRQDMSKYNSGLDQNMRLANLGYQNQAEMMNAAGMNQWNQTQADRQYGSGVAAYQQGLNNLNSVYGAKTGSAQHSNQMRQQVGQGVGDAVQTGAKIAGTIAGGPIGGMVVNAAGQG